MISAIYLAAGKSSRFSGFNKLLKIYNGKELFLHSLENLQKSIVNKIIFVTGKDKKIIKKKIKKFKKIIFVYNKNYRLGISSSIITGIKMLPKNTKFFFIVLADMPHIKFDFYKFMISQALKYKDKNIFIPIYKKKFGNPILFNYSFKEKLLFMKGDFGAKKIIKKNFTKIKFLKFKYNSILKDYDTDDDFVKNNYS
jgi:molybdenum cofactor cytidylyltransferase